MIFDPNALRNQKRDGRPIAMVTAYTVFSARLAEAAGIDLILVGDSAANVVFGHHSTRDIGMEEMVLCTGAVSRGAQNTPIVVDLPWGSDLTPEEGVAHSRELLQAGGDAVKLEMTPHAWEVAEAICRAGIPLVGHLGLLPQSAVSLKQHARTAEERERVLAEGRRLERMGAVALVVEHVPDEVGAALSEAVAIPVIGIGAGPQTDGQVLVFHDLLGLSEKTPPIAKKFVAGEEFLRQGMEEYVAWVRRRGRVDE